MSLEAILAEVGDDIALPLALAPRVVGRHCPGHHESDGKRKSSRIRRGDLWLRRHSWKRPGLPRVRVGPMCTLTITGWHETES